MPNDLLSILLQRAQEAEPQVEPWGEAKYKEAEKKNPDQLLKEAQDYASQHPRAAEAQRAAKVVNAPTLTKLNGMLTMWGEPYGRSFSIPALNRVFMAPDDPNYKKTYAHELGHIDQNLQGGRAGYMDHGNDDTADTILRDLMQMEQVRKSILPEPYKPLDPATAENAMEVGWVPLTEQARLQRIKNKGVE